MSADGPRQSVTPPRRESTADAKQKMSADGPRQSVTPPRRASTADAKMWRRHSSRIRSITRMTALHEPGTSDEDNDSEPEKQQGLQFPLLFRDATSRPPLQVHDEETAVRAIRHFATTLRNDTGPPIEQSWVLSCGDDGTLRNTDLATGKAIGHPLKGHKGPVHDCCIFPGGDRALSCGDDGDLRLWALDPPTDDSQLQTKEPIATGHLKRVTACCLFPAEPSGDVKYALTASLDETLKVWNLVTEKEVLQLTASTEVNSCCVFTSSRAGLWNGQIHALSAGADNHIRRWRLDDLEMQRLDDPEMPRQIQHADKRPWLAKDDPVSGKVGHTGIVYCCHVSDDGTRALSCGGDNRAIYWDMPSGEALRVLEERSCHMNSCCLAEEKGLAVTVSNTAARVWDVHSGELLRTFFGHTSDITGCQVILGGTQVVTCGNSGTVRVWGLLHTDDSGKLELEKPKKHRELVKELCVIPGKELMVMTCSYDNTAKVWDLTRRTSTCEATLKGHTDHVNDCCAFPAEEGEGEVRRVLTGSSDGTVRVWDWRKQKCELIISHLQGGVVTEQVHEQRKSGCRVRGCGVVNDRLKVYSCADDATICLFELKFDKSERWSAELKHRLKGHSMLIDRCEVYRGGARMISASWDKTCKVWNLESGECERTLQNDNDNNKVRGVVVYAEGKRAVMAGSGKWLTVWDLETGNLETQVKHDHRSTVWGLRMIPVDDSAQRLGLDKTVASEKQVFVVATYSNDRMIKVWHLPDGDGRKRDISEIVHARRAANGPMCVAVLPPSHELGCLPILVGGKDGSITLADMSHLGAGPSAGAIWAGRSCMPTSQWAEWILEAIDESSAHFLCAPERVYDAEKKERQSTMIHKLAAVDDGHTVLQKIKSHFDQHRAVILGREEYEEEKHAKALPTIGLLSRSTTDSSVDRRSALAVATKYSQEDTAQWLLDDYRDHIVILNPNVSDNFYDFCSFATEAAEMTEQDMLPLFDKFPSLVADFVHDLPLQGTRLVKPRSKYAFVCSFFSPKHSDNRLIQGSLEPSPPVDEHGDPASLWWDGFIDETWEQRNYRLTGKSVEEKKKHSTDESADDENFINAKTAYSEAYEALPDKQHMTTNRQIESEEYLQARTKYLEARTKYLEARHKLRVADSAWGVKVVSARVAIKGNGNPVQQKDKAEDLPFSRLLRKCCEHAERVGNPDVFGSSSLEAIIQYKWNVVEPIYYALFAHYLLFCVLFTLTTSLFHDWTCGMHSECLNDDSGGRTATRQRWIDANLQSFSPAWYRMYGGWLLFFSTAALWVMLIRHEYLQIRFHWKNKDFQQYSQKYSNWWDLMSLMCSSCSLLWICVYPQDATPAGRWTPPPDRSEARPLFFYHPLRTLRAVALFTTWFNSFQWFFGIEILFFNVTVLYENFRSLPNPVVILLILALSFTLAFDELLGIDEDFVITTDGFTGPYDEMSRSFRTVLGLFLGDFDSDVYLDQHGAAPFVSFFLFLLYMFVVTIIMMNLLIAAMTESYETVNEKKKLFMLRERAEQLLAVESILLRHQDLHVPVQSPTDDQNAITDDQKAIIRYGVPKHNMVSRIALTVRAILRIPTEYPHPSYIHTLSEIKLDLTSGASEDPIWRQTKGAMERLIEGKMSTMDEKLEDKIKTIDDKMKTMDEKLSTVVDTLGQLNSMLTFEAAGAQDGPPITVYVKD